MEEYCKVNGYPVYKDEKYLDMLVGESYRTSFYMIGDKILFMKTEGDMSTSNLTAILKKRDAFLDQFFRTRKVNPQNQKVVEIRDLSGTCGRPDHHNKNVQTEFILSSNNRLLAFIMIGIPKVSEIIYKVGLNFIGSPIPIEIYKNDTIAIKKALTYVESENGLSVPDQKNWEYSGDNFRINISVLKKTILLIKGNGFLSNSYLSGLKKVIREVYQYGDFDKQNYYRIIDYSNITGSTLKGRIGYIKIWNKIFKEFDAQPVRSFICGANQLVKTSIKLSSTFLNMDIVYVENVAVALKQIKHKGRIVSDQDNEVVIKRNEINKLIAFIGNIGWEMQDLGLEERQIESFNNPLDEVIDAIKVLSGDVKSLVNNEKKIKSELEKQNQQLRLAKLEAQKANLAKSRFLDTMSHELRTPMNSMVGFLDLALDTEVTEEQREYLQNIKTSTYSLLEKIKDILAYTGLEDNNPKTNKDYILIRDYLSQLQSKTKSQLKNDLDVLLDIDHTIPELLELDPVILDNVFKILINNAIKFTEDGYIRIFVKMVDFSSDIQKVIVQFGVEDTGIGIPEDKQAMIFETFTQVDSKISRNYEGSGLGLAIFKKLITGIDGYVNIENNDQKGCRFTFTLDVNYH